MSDSAIYTQYHHSEMAAVESLGNHYMRHGEYKKARCLFEAAYQMSGEKDNGLLGLIAENAYHEGNMDVFSAAIKKCSAEKSPNSTVKKLVCLYMFLNGNKKSYSLFSKIYK